MDKNDIYSWVNNKVEIRDTGEYGLGIFAKQRIPLGEVIMVMGGHILCTDEENLLGEFATNYNMDISEEYSFCPKNKDDLRKMPQHLINHSCEPNCGFVDVNQIVAIREISLGEQIVYDYAFVMWSSDQSSNHYQLYCQCGAPNCRKTITENDWMIKELQEKYGQYFQSFLKSKFK